MRTRRRFESVEHECLFEAVALGLRSRVEVPGTRAYPLPIDRMRDWESLFELARIHGVVGLLYEGLLADSRQRAKTNESHCRALRKLSELHAAEIQRSVYLSAELMRVLTLLKTNGIRGVPIKGPLLAHRVYGNIGLRRFWDLDILVTKEAVIEAKRLLEADGYQPEAVWSAGTLRRELRSGCECNFDHPERGIHLELHWRFFPSYIAYGGPSVSTSAILDRTEPITFMGDEVEALSIVDELIALAVHHAVKHHWEQLRMVADIAAFIARLEDRASRTDAGAETDAKEDGTISTLIARAETTGALRAVATGILLARDCLGIAVPRSLLIWATGDRTIRVLAQRFRSRLTRRERRKRLDAVECATDSLRLRERRRDQIRYMPHLAKAVLLPTDKERAVLPLPESLSFLHFFLRPFRLLHKYLSRR